jgi:diadenosine tetraphosphatase ApaH/serine/threonine PP2A family protein phosphatase
VVDLLAGRDVVAVAGNHDYAAVGRMALDWFNAYARDAVEWTANQLTVSQSRYLTDLPLVAGLSDAMLVHSSPRNPGAWTYLISEDDGAAAFSAFATSVCFVGHTHLPAVWTEHADGGVVFRRGAGRVTLAPGARYLVNVGSVGQPRDGDPYAAYALWDLDTSTVEIRRVPYDIEEARRRVLAAGLPKLLGDRLLRGR